MAARRADRRNIAIRTSMTGIGRVLHLFPFMLSLRIRTAESILRLLHFNTESASLQPPPSENRRHTPSGCAACFFSRMGACQSMVISILKRMILRRVFFGKSSSRTRSNPIFLYGTARRL